MRLTPGVACLSLASLAAADWRFRSRPELAAPRLNITVPADRRAVEKGFIFVAPYEGFEEGHSGPVQPGAYIFRDDGELVWSGIGHHSGWVANFRPDTWNGKPYLHSAFPLNFGAGLPGSGKSETDAWNYFHINSVDKDEEGNYLISARNVAAVFKINGTSGEIIWQLGGFHGGSSFTLASEDVFGYQHHARFRSRSADGKIEIISLFDNGAHSAPEKTNAFSRGRIYQLNHTDGTARAIRTYDAPDGLSAHTQGSLQILPNDNIFINWGQSGAVTEYSHEGKVLFHAYLDSAPKGIFTQSYRGFRYNWTGTPAEEPAIVTFKGDRDGELDVYASWNGDTEAAAWRFYARFAAKSKEDLLGEVEREGFETHTKFRGVAVADDIAIIAEAVGKDGRALRKTRPVPISFDLANPPSEPKWGSDEL
ncbi:hypothetical protein K4K60_007122 [Colletotrichum sp. SAR11_57]|nr:hypothetical protein K4K60_007122 [Colletotrichum sp. SAR11_57]